MNRMRASVLTQGGFEPLIFGFTAYHSNVLATYVLDTNKCKFRAFRVPQTIPKAKIAHCHTNVIL